MRPKRYLPQESKQLDHDCPTLTPSLDGFFLRKASFEPEVGSSPSGRRIAATRFGHHVVTSQCRSEAERIAFVTPPTLVLRHDWPKEAGTRSDPLARVAKSGWVSEIPPPSDRVAGDYPGRRPRAALVIRHEGAVADPEPPRPIRFDRNPDSRADHDHLRLPRWKLERH